MKLGRLYFCCHPDFNDFQMLQTYETEQRVALASNMICKGVVSNGFTDAWGAGLALMLRLNSPDAEFLSGGP